MSIDQQTLRFFGRPRKLDHTPRFRASSATFPFDGTAAALCFLQATAFPAPQRELVGHVEPEMGAVADDAGRGMGSAGPPGRVNHERPEGLGRVARA